MAGVLAKGIALAAIYNAAIVPTVNIRCVMVFARHGASKLTGRGMLRRLATDPLLSSSWGGIVFRMLGLDLSPDLEPAVEALYTASLLLGLLCIGAALDFRTAGQ